MSSPVLAEAAALHRKAMEAMDAVTLRKASGEPVDELIRAAFEADFCAGAPRIGAAAA